MALSRQVSLQAISFQKANLTQNESATRMTDQKTSQDTKAPAQYSKPELKDLGPLKDLTRGGMSGTTDGMSYS